MIVASASMIGHIFIMRTVCLIRPALVRRLDRDQIDNHRTTSEGQGTTNGNDVDNCPYRVVPCLSPLFFSRGTPRESRRTKNVGRRIIRPFEIFSEIYLWIVFEVFLAVFLAPKWTVGFKLEYEIGCQPLGIRARARVA